MTTLLQNIDIFELHIEAIVITTNCKRVLGAGLARQFANVMPLTARQYRNCRIPLDPGTVECYDVLDAGHVCKRVVTFTTKEHWRYPSRRFWIVRGMEKLIELCDDLDIRSIAIPPLGCGLGGLSWEDDGIERIVMNGAETLEARGTKVTVIRP